jgi:hypothetical protein
VPQTAYDKLFAFRENRIKPGLDDNHLLFERRLVEAYRNFGEESYLDQRVKEC